MGAYALIAETDPPHAAVYSEAAAAEGFETIVARDGEQALALCRERGMPAVIITDLTLARLDGFGLLREVRRAAPKSQPPAIVVSAFKEQRVAADTLKDQLAIKAILPKTRQVETIRRSLKRVIRIVVLELGVLPQCFEGAREVVDDMRQIRRADLEHPLVPGAECGRRQVRGSYVRCRQPVGPLEQPRLGV